MITGIANKKLNYLKLLKELYDGKIITLKKMEKLFKYYQKYKNPFEKPIKYDRYMELYLEDKICIDLLRELHIFDNNDTLKN